jgi:hypothetical protein
MADLGADSKHEHSIDQPATERNSEHPGLSLIVALHRQSRPNFPRPDPATPRRVRWVEVTVIFPRSDSADLMMPLAIFQFDPDLDMPVRIIEGHLCQAVLGLLSSAQDFV